MSHKAVSQGLIASDRGDHGITSPGPREGCIRAMIQRNVLSRCDSSWLMTGEEIAGPVLERERAVGRDNTQSQDQDQDRTEQR